MSRDVWAVSCTWSIVEVMSPAFGCQRYCWVIRVAHTSLALPIWVAQNVQNRTDLTTVLWYLSDGKGWEGPWPFYQSMVVVLPNFVPQAGQLGISDFYRY
jgi:hypothetical protein